MKKDRYAYVAIFSYEEDGISIEFPDLPGCYPCAGKDDTAAAITNAKEAMGLHVWGMEQDEEEIPEATPITKLVLEPHQVPFLVEVFMPPVRERINSKFVKKTLSLPAWLAAKADEEGVNCSRIFQNALMEYLQLEAPKGLIKKINDYRKALQRISSATLSFLLFISFSS